MSGVPSDIATLLVRELEGFRREVSSFPDDESLWRTVPGVTNSAGNLALHVAGNLRHFVGAVLGGSGYLRNREREFGQRSGTRADVTEELDAALAVVRDALAHLSADQLGEPFPEAVMGMTLRTGPFLMHLCAHAAFHLGQAGYLRRILTRDATSSGPIPLEPLA